MRQLVGRGGSDPAAEAQTAQLVLGVRRLVNDLRAALEGKAVIDQAVGVLMSRSGSTSQEAFGRLRTRSELENRPLLSVAQSVLVAAARESAQPI